MKTCTKCGECKALAAFSKDKASKDGLRWRCKACDTEALTKWRAKNPDKVRAAAAKYDAANPDKKRSYGRKAAALARTKNPEKIKAASAKWKAKNADKMRAQVAKRAAAQRQATPPWADQPAIVAVYAEQQAYINLGVDVHVDHIIPLRGKLVSGLHVHNNLRVILADDNLTKSNTFTPA